MTTSKEQLTDSTITVTLASLGNAAYRQSAAIDNSSNLYLDAAVELKVKTGTGTVATGTVNVYAYGSADGGTTYTGGASGSNASYTSDSPTNLKLIGVINANVDATSFVGGPFSVANAFGYLPKNWGIVVQNSTGAALDSTEGNHVKLYEGQTIQTA